MLQRNSDWIEEKKIIIYRRMAKQWTRLPRVTVESQYPEIL